MRIQATAISATGLLVFGLCLAQVAAGAGQGDQADHVTEAEKAVIETGNYLHLYKTKYINDHCVIYDDVNRKWHMYGIGGTSGAFIHLTADSLTQVPWKRAEDFTYKTPIWAPHIIYHDNTFWMFFTSIGNPRKIVLATCDDLEKGEWTIDPEINPVRAFVTPEGANGKNKDCMVIRHEGQWIMYYSMVKKHVDGKDWWAVGYSTSADLKHWSEPEIAFDDDVPADPSVESPFVVKRGPYYYLFISARPWGKGDGVEVFRSKLPFSWDPKTDRVKRWERNQVHAMEVVEDFDGKSYMTHCGAGNGGWWIAPLKWEDGVRKR